MTAYLPLGSSNGPRSGQTLNSYCGQRQQRESGVAKYIVGTVEYTSKKQLKQELSNAKLEKEHLSVVTDPVIVETLTALLELHPDADDKIGDGIDHWVVFDNSVDTAYTSTGFRPVRVDGSGPIKFSYTDVIDKPSHKQLVQEALTLEALPITLDYRKSRFGNGPVVCCRTGEEIYDYKDAQAVHLDPPRRILHADFLKRVGLSYGEVALEKHPTDSGYRLRDRVLAERWCDYQAHHLDGMAIAKLQRRAPAKGQ